MDIGFYHSCFLDWELPRTFAWAHEHGFRGIELHGGPKYRHINWREIAEGRGTTAILELQEKYEIPIIGIMFGAIPFLSPNAVERAKAVDEIDVLLRAAHQLGIKMVSTFTGRDPAKTLEENLDLYEHVFPPIAAMAEKLDVKLAFENCPMYEFWPPVYNIAVSPYMWKELFDRVPSSALGLNIDPSHLIWQGIEVAGAVHEFKDRIIGAQAKDTERLTHIMRREGLLTHRWWRHRIPGQGEVDWNGFVTALHEIGYDGVLSIEHEDPVWSGTEERVERGMLLAQQHLQQFL